MRLRPSTVRFCQVSFIRVAASFAAVLLVATFTPEAGAKLKLPKEQSIAATKWITWRAKRPGPTDAGSYEWQLRTEADDAEHIDPKDIKQEPQNGGKGTGSWLLKDGLTTPTKSIESGGGGEPRAKSEHSFTVQKPDTTLTANTDQCDILATMTTTVETELVDPEDEHTYQQVKATSFGKLTIASGKVTAAEAQNAGEKRVEVKKLIGKTGVPFGGRSWGEAPASWYDPIRIEILEIETGHRVVETLYHVDLMMTGMASLVWNDADGIVIQAPGDESEASIVADFSSPWITHSTGAYSARLDDGVFTTGGALAGLPWQLTMEGTRVVRAQLPAPWVPVLEIRYVVPPFLFVPGLTYQESLIADDGALSEQECCLKAVDGRLGPGLPVTALQTTQTGFGDNTIGAIDLANGSELDQAHAVVDGDTLRLFLGGNLESNYNKLEIFIDDRPGGQNRLRGDNADIDWNGLNRMGDDGSGNGLRFDLGFEPDHWLSVTGVPGPNGYQLYASFAELPSFGGGTGMYLGRTSAGGDGSLIEGFNPHAIRAAIDNVNTGGVGGGCGVAEPDTVVTGIEFAVPLAALGYPTGCIKITAFVNGTAHEYVSNQVLGPLPAGWCNLGEPRFVDFEAIPGAQHFAVCATPTTLGVTPVVVTAAGRLQAWPNPSRGAVRLSFETPDRNVSHVDVFDVAGRKVKGLAGPAAGAATLDWDGRGDDGRLVPAGVYMVRARTERGALSTVVLRTQ